MKNYTTTPPMQNGPLVFILASRLHVHVLELGYQGDTWFVDLRRIYSDYFKVSLNKCTSSIFDH